MKKKQNPLTIAACVIDLAAVIVIAVSFISAGIPGFRISAVFHLTPPLFGIAGLITAALGLPGRGKKGNTRLGVALVIVNVILIGWWYILDLGGKLLLGL